MMTYMPSAFLADTNKYNKDKDFFIVSQSPNLTATCTLKG